MPRRVVIFVGVLALLGLGVSVSLALMPGALAPATSATEAHAPTEVKAPQEVGSRWGRNYFPNVELTTHQGKKVRFFDDLVKDKVVVINFIYTSCPDSCPLETARLSQVEKILGERVGQDVFMYSITIDPENDTAEVLAQYRKRYDAGPGWTFLTGDEQEIVDLRKKLGLYIAEIQGDDSNNHNLSLIIGNQKTGRWMKRSPFENPHVLATHVGSWLHNWKQPSEDKRDYADAPKLRSLSDGERLFRTRCAACHTIGGQVVGGSVATDATKMGPDLLGVTKRREPKWLRRWIAEPDKMLEEKDPIAMELFEQFEQVPMPNMRLSAVDVEDLVEFLEEESARVAGEPAAAKVATGEKKLARASKKLGARERPARSAKVAVAKERLTTVAPAKPVVTVFVQGAWIREAHPDAKVNAGYLTLRNTGGSDEVLVAVKSPTFEKVELHEMSMKGGTMKMVALPSLRVPAGGELRLKPRGKHLMLKVPRRRLTAGHSVRLTLVFESGLEQTITVPVRS